MTIQIDKDQIVEAAYVSGWNMSIFGQPKMKILCGSCGHTFRTRDYYPFTREGRSHGFVAKCPCCPKWNRLNLVVS